MPPSRIRELTPGDVTAALKGWAEDHREAWRRAALAAFPHLAKKNERLDSFFRRLGVGYQKSARNSAEDIERQRRRAHEIAQEVRRELGS